MSENCESTDRDKVYAAELRGSIFSTCIRRKKMTGGKGYCSSGSTGVQRHVKFIKHQAFLLEISQENKQATVTVDRLAQ